MAATPPPSLPPSLFLAFPTLRKRILLHVVSCTLNKFRDKYSDILKLSRERHGYAHSSSVLAAYHLHARIDFSPVPRVKHDIKWEAETCFFPRCIRLYLRFRQEFEQDACNGIEEISSWSCVRYSQSEHFSFVYAFLAILSSLNSILSHYLYYSLAKSRTPAPLSS